MFGGIYSEQDCPLCGQRMRDNGRDRVCCPKHRNQVTNNVYVKFGRSVKRRNSNTYSPRIWDSYVWLPCGDGKVRRAPDDSIQLVDGLHRSVLGALGNSIVPQVAAEIMMAMRDVGGLV